MTVVDRETGQGQMLDGCITGNGGRLTAIAIKRFNLFESDLDGDEFSEAMDRLWKEKHGHPLTPSRPKAARRIKTDAFHHYCNGCERVLPVDAFSVDRSRARGISNRCKDCAARNWKRVNGHICESCASSCVGRICRRCLLIQVRIREAELIVGSSISFPIWQRQREFRSFARRLANDTNLTRSQKLTALLAWKPENLQS